MPTSFRELITAALSSRKFTKFFDGVPFGLPDGKKIAVKVDSHEKGLREDGYRIAKYSFVTRAVTDQGIEGFGFGEGETELLTFQKSIAESVERAVYLSLKPYLHSTSSNGWAAHLTEEKAKMAAMNELLERDAALVHWLTEKPFFELNPAEFPLWLRNWRDQVLSGSSDFNILRVLISTTGFIPVVQVVLLNRAGYAFTSQATATNLDQAIYRALSEVCRIISAAKYDRTLVDVSLEESVATPWDHALAYESTEFPSWVFGSVISTHEAHTAFQRPPLKTLLALVSPQFLTYRCGDLFITRCESDKVQNLFFGKNDFALKRGQINLDRLKEAKPDIRLLNPLLHSVP